MLFVLVEIIQMVQLIILNFSIDILTQENISHLKEEKIELIQVIRLLIRIIVIFTFFLGVTTIYL
jgi:hypothetical protein